MGRRFVTKVEIDALADRGETVLEVNERTTLTDLAREDAMQRGVSVVQEGLPRIGSTARAGHDHELRAAVRSAVVDSLGEVPAGLDEALDRVLARRLATDKGGPLVSGDG